MTGDRSTPTDVPREPGPSRRNHAHAALLRGVRTVSVCFLLLVLAFVGVDALTALQERARVQVQRDALAADLHLMWDLVEDLEGEVSRIVDDGDVLRIAAGLLPLDRELVEVGIGGPGLPATSEGVLSRTSPELVEVAFAVRWDLNALERRTRLLMEGYSQVADSLRYQRDLLLSTPSILPVQGRVSSGFAAARFHPIHRERVPHMGLDISAPRGTPIRAVARGTVVSAERRGGYGLTVELDHGFGYQTLYGHASRIFVRSGDLVERGDVIGSVGSSGTATGPHLHYEVRLNGQLQNPMHYVLPEPDRMAQRSQEADG